ncbi:UNVERIFIED_CONTAM: polyprotein [Sesamum latifolium]|uniref:Polyprotein n=1 Tax=Sesamum latifolium TaxID=2727402 RepID=A0AAW2WDD9_9LAMI
MTPNDLALAREECSQLLALGLIKPTKSNWACLVFYVNKRTKQIRGKKRLVIDYKALNHFLLDDKFPLPKTQIEEFLELAHRVIDDGDDRSWAALGELKRKWEAKVGPLKSSGHTANPPMMSTTSLVRSVRKALRTLKPIPPAAATLNLTGIAGSLSMGAAAHNSNMHAPMENPNLHAPSTVEPATSLAEEIPLAQLATMPILGGSASTPDHPEEPTEARSPRVSGNSPIGETVPTPCGAGSSLDFLGGGDTNSGCTVPQVARLVGKATGIFVGSVLLHATGPLMQPDNTFAETFTTSSQKTLRYVRPIDRTESLLYVPRLI